jgi:hypothetical protein
MIVSHRYKYLFVEFPHTASTAIRGELLAHYNGVPILHKHATHIDFKKIATAEEKNYFVFSCIRNPLDVAVTVYHKCRKLNSRITEYPKVKRYHLHHWLIEGRKAALVASARTDFPTYFRRTYRLPHSDWSNLAHLDFDFIIRYENLQEDLAQVLKLLGIEQKKPLALVNRTDGKSRDFISYYTPDIIPRARWVFGPYMQAWGYRFPEEWGDEPVHWLNQLEYCIICMLRNFYWQHLRWRIFQKQAIQHSKQ